MSDALEKPAPLSAARHLWQRADRWTLVGLLTLGLSLLLFIPFNLFPVNSADLDDSWRLALNWAFTRHLQFGKDVVFTYGPWGFVDSRTYYPATFAWVLLGWGFFAVTFWRVSWLLARRYIPHAGLGLAWIVLLTVAAVAFRQYEPASFMCVPVLVLVYYFLLEKRQASWTWLALLLCAAMVGPPGTSIRLRRNETKCQKKERPRITRMNADKKSG